MSALASLGFRHVVEDGLAILAGDHELSRERQEFVLEDLHEIVAEIVRLPTAAPLTVVKVSSEARQLFALLLRRPPCDDINWTRHLSHAERALQKLIEGHEITAGEREDTRVLLQETLSTVRALPPLRAMEMT